MAALGVVPDEGPPLDRTSARPTIIDQGRLSLVHHEETGGSAGPHAFDAVLAGARASESWAFTDLFARMGSPVHGFLRARGADDPEGLANEVLLKAFRSIGRFEGGETEFRAWVFTIARNSLIDQRRHRGRRPKLDPVAPEAFPDEPHTDPEPAALQADRLRTLLDQLTPEQREVVLLRVVGGLPVREVAEVIGKSEGAVKLLQHRGIETLRRLMVRDP